MLLELLLQDVQLNAVAHVEISVLLRLGFLMITSFSFIAAIFFKFLLLGVCQPILIVRARGYGKHKIEIPNFYDTFP